MKKLSYIVMVGMFPLLSLGADANPFSNFKPYETEKTGPKQPEASQSQSAEEGQRQGQQSSQAQFDE